MAVSARLAGRDLTLIGRAMYIHRMIRTQLYLDEDVHRRLKAMAARHGRTISDLVRDAIRQAYGGAEADERLVTLDRVAGIWRDREELGAAVEYVRRLRRGTRRRRLRG
ncbi:MAG: hypothetical protein KatS3mg081_2102 [Gemmatimonadales bacterium]|nr:hypothetical protein HRbin33_01129 [bacterium HR33]GIW52747.1 MAG: hypothetical protein KatS3mg081_2102 [Gemmatimonadales bacterium]